MQSSIISNKAPDVQVACSRFKSASPQSNPVQSKTQHGELLEWAIQNMLRSITTHKYTNMRRVPTRRGGLSPAYRCCIMHFIEYMQLWAIKIHFKCPPLEMDVRDMLHWMGEWCARAVHRDNASFVYMGLVGDLCPAEHNVWCTVRL